MAQRARHESPRYFLCLIKPHMHRRLASYMRVHRETSTVPVYSNVITPQGGWSIRSYILNTRTPVSMLQRIFSPRTYGSTLPQSSNSEHILRSDISKGTFIVTNVGGTPMVVKATCRLSIQIPVASSLLRACESTCHDAAVLVTQSPSSSS